VQASKSCSDDHYGYLVTWSAEDGGFVGTCLEFPGLSHLAQDRAEALSGIETLVGDVVLDMRSSGEEPPAPFSERSFSGEFMTRVPAELHWRLAMEAAETGVSLNRLVSFKLALPMTSGRPAATKSRRDVLAQPTGGAGKPAKNPCSGRGPPNRHSASARVPWGRRSPLA
jgi:predicted HicB family RNase H-like nuclease